MSSPLRVVIVDDEPPARAVVREYVERLQDVTIVAECANGFEAVKAVSELSPDLLLLDVQMPKLNGFEVLELLGRSVPIVFVTGYQAAAIDQRFAGFPVLTKPVEKNELALALARAIERSDGAQEHAV